MPLRHDNRYQNIVRRGGLGGPLGMRKLDRLPSKCFAQNFWIATSGMMSNPPLQFCLAMMREDRVLVAVDYPCEQTAEAVSFIRNAPLSPETLRKVTQANAERLFKIAPAA